MSGEVRRCVKMIPNRMIGCRERHIGIPFGPTRDYGDFLDDRDVHGDPDVAFGQLNQLKRISWV